MDTGYVISNEKIGLGIEFLSERKVESSGSVGQSGGRTKCSGVETSNCSCSGEPRKEKRGRFNLWNLANYGDST